MEVMISAAFTFILVMDPLGNVPLFLASLKNTAPERRQWVILRECLIALVVMVSFLFAGRGLLNLLHVDDAALKAAGGVILLLISIRMVFPTPEKNLAEPVTHDEPFIVPLAVPYVAGPSLLAIIVVFVELWAIAFIQNRYMETPFFRAVMQVVLGGSLVLAAGVLIGNA